MNQYITKTGTKELASAVLVNRVKQFFKSFSLATLATKGLEKNNYYTVFLFLWFYFIVPFSMEI